MLYIKLFIVAYCVVSILTVLMVLSVVDSKGFRLAFIVLGFTMPLIFVYAAISSLFNPKPMPRFDKEMAGIEDEIETERIRIFGGERICPSFSDHWQKAYQVYLERLVQRAATTSEKVVSLGGIFQHHHGSRAA
jgi:hypothetical protein